MAQAKIFHKQLGITTPCDYTSGWYTKFKKRNVFLSWQCGEKESADYDVAEAYLGDCKISW
jgi:hypothetical protein